MLTDTSLKTVVDSKTARLLQVRAASGNGASPAGGEGEYDYDLFTIGAGSGGVRASRFAATTFGARRPPPHPLCR